MRRAVDFSVLFLDLNSYFASVEQQEDPALRHRPVAVAPLDSDFTAAIAVSYEARDLGVRRGMRIAEARAACPDLIVRVSRPELYVRYHHRLTAAIERRAPIDRVHSIDEASCRLIGPQRAPDVARALALAIKAEIAASVGPFIRCSIGVSATALLAKIAAGLRKPDGLTLATTQEMRARMTALALRDIPGIGPAMEERLRRAGIVDVAGLMALQPKQARAIWGNVTGERFWYGLHGYDCPEPATRRGIIGHSRVLDPRLRDPAEARLVARELALKAARRLRRQELCAGCVALSVRLTCGDGLGAELRLAPTQDSFAILGALDALWRGFHLGPSRRIKHVGVLLSRLTPLIERPRDLFEAADGRARRREALWRTIDGLRRGRAAPVTLASQLPIHLADLGSKIAFTRIPELSEFSE